MIAFLFNTTVLNINNMLDINVALENYITSKDNKTTFTNVTRGNITISINTIDRL